MKPLICDLCGSNEVVKDGAYFVCQYCDTKYTIETARQMMFGDGPIEVSGTVVIDNRADLEAALANARRAKSKEDWDESAKYYDMAERIDPANIEAIFYSSYGKAKMSLIDSDIHKRRQAFRVLANCVGMIDDKWDSEYADAEALLQISRDILGMSSSGFVYNETTTELGITVQSDRKQTIELYESLNKAFVSTLEKILRKDDTLLCRKLIADHYSALVSINKSQGWTRDRDDAGLWSQKSQKAIDYVNSTLKRNPEHKKDLEDAFWSENDEDWQKYNVIVKNNAIFAERVERLEAEKADLGRLFYVHPRRYEIEEGIESAKNSIEKNLRILDRIQRSQSDFVMLNWECEVE